jgi:hypothetical protein
VVRDSTCPGLRNTKNPAKRRVKRWSKKAGKTMRSGYPQSRVSGKVESRSNRRGQNDRLCVWGSRVSFACRARIADALMLRGVDAEGILDHIQTHFVGIEIGPLLSKRSQFFVGATLSVGRAGTMSSCNCGVQPPIRNSLPDNRSDIWRIRCTFRRKLYGMTKSKAISHI